MSPLLDRISAFFLDPPGDRDSPAFTDTAPDRGGPLGLADASNVRGYAPPLPPGHAVPEASGPGQDAAAGPRSASASYAPARPGPPQVAASEPAAAAAGSDLSAPHGFAAVIGAPAAAIPVAAACAGELRVQARAAAAVLCVWHGRELPAGATTPAVRRLAARLAAAELAATACGRLAWVTLAAEPRQAAEQVRQCRAIVPVPLVVAVAGPRVPAFEPLLAETDVTIAVLPAEAEDALRVLAVATLPSREALVLPPLPPGPPRWAAMAGLARLRALKARP